jgi:hypothetical protein
MINTMFGCEEPEGTSEVGSEGSAEIPSPAASQMLAVNVKITIPDLPITELLTAVVMADVRRTLARRLSTFA